MWKQQDFYINISDFVCLGSYGGYYTTIYHDNIEVAKSLRDFVYGSV
jgi:hypothetical protein